MASNGLAGSLLVGNGGWLVTDLLTEPARRRLADEAVAAHRGATEARVRFERDTDSRRGQPDRWLESATGGPALTTLYRSAALRRLLARITGRSWQPSGTHASFSFYRRPGHYLGLHRDVEVCDLAVIACVADTVGSPDAARAGGPDSARDPAAAADAAALVVYPQRAGDALAAIRADGRGSVAIALSPGRAVVLLGGVVPHEVLPSTGQRVRIVAPMCFRPAPL